MDTEKEGKETYGKKIGRECDKKRIKKKKRKRDKRTERKSRPRNGSKKASVHLKGIHQIF